MIDFKGKYELLVVMNLNIMIVVLLADINYALIQRETLLFVMDIGIQIKKSVGILIKIVLMR